MLASGEAKSGHLSSLKRPWALVCETAGLQGRWRIHDLRHAFASAAVNSGASLPMIGALLGHSQVSATSRYSHLAANPLHKAAEDVGARIAEALQSQPQSGGGIIAFRPRQAQRR